MTRLPPIRMGKPKSIAGVFPPLFGEFRVAMVELFEDIIRQIYLSLCVAEINVYLDFFPIGS